MRRTLARSRLAVLLLAAACDSPARSGTPPSGPPPAAVEIVAVRHEPISDVVDLVGQLDAEESVVLKSETEGIVDSIDFQDGDEVDAGHLLFRLRDGEQRAKLREAEAALTLAEDEFGRAKALAAQKTVSQSELDRATAEAEAARARRDMAQVALDRMSIRAPFDGVLGARTFTRAPEGSTIDYTDRYQRAVEQTIMTYPEIDKAFSVVALGIGTPGLVNEGAIFANLTPWEDRSRTQMAIVDELRRQLGSLGGIEAFPANLPALSNNAGIAPVSLVVQGPTSRSLPATPTRSCAGCARFPAW